MNDVWNKIPAMAKAIILTVAALTAIGTAITWVRAGYDNLSTEAERKLVEQHHEEDMQNVFNVLAEQKRLDRIQRNERELKRLERDLLGGKYSSEEEKEFIKLEIQDLKRAIRCDEQGDCS